MITGKDILETWFIALILTFAFPPLGILILMCNTVLSAHWMYKRMVGAV